MKRNRRIRLHGFAVIPTLSLLLITLLPGTAAAQEARGGAAGDWLTSYQSARSLGLGGAFVAASHEPLGALWNPAGITRMFRNEVHLETARLFEGTSINSLSFAVPNRSLPSLGISVVALGSGEFERTNELNQSLGEFKETDTAFYLTASQALSPRFSIGANVKIVRQAIEEFGATGVGADLGLLYDFTPSLRVGASVLNLGGPSLTLRDESESYPTEFRGGLALQVMSGRGLVSAEVNSRSGPGTTFHGGAEFWVHSKLALRLGFNETVAAGGLSFRVNPNIDVDYGVSDHELGLTHRIGFSYRFGGFFASSQANPPAFSPIGTQSVTKFHLKTRTKSDASNWRLEITDKSHQIVRKFGGMGVPPAHVMWDGKDETGLPLADGFYRYQLVVIDEEGRQIAGTPGTVEITTAGPEGFVPVVVDKNKTKN